MIAYLQDSIGLFILGEVAGDPISELGKLRAAFPEECVGLACDESRLPKIEKRAALVEPAVTADEQRVRAKAVAYAALVANGRLRGRRGV